jgi:WXG100 family type VII secretion target
MLLFIRKEQLMSDQIEVRYDEMQQIAGKFNAQSQSVQDTLQRVKSTMEQLKNGGWEGRGSDAFFSEMEGEVLPAVQRLVQALEEAAQVTQKIVQVVQGAEQDASSLFRQAT